MGKKKRFFELNEESSESEEFNDDDDDDSDVEIQKAFEKGELKPGLHGLVALKRNQHVNNVKGLKKKFTEIKLNYDWIERLDLTTEPAKLDPKLEAQYGDMNIKVNKKGQIVDDELHDKAQHDFKREMLFYRHSQAAVLEAIPRLHRLNVKTKRPEDYFAEMAKSDDHMKKVRENIEHRKNAMEASENARRLRELRKYGKKIQHEVLAKRQKEKKEFMEKVKKFKKGKESLDFIEKGANAGGQNKKVNQKRQHKNKRFGFGGQKKRDKYNSAQSSADMSSFSRKKHGKPKNNKRPGKSVRIKLKNRKKMK